MGENAAAAVLARLGEQVVDVAVKVRCSLVNDQEGGLARVLRDRGAFSTAEVRVR
jgi:hypothetical protein